MFTKKSKPAAIQPQTKGTSTEPVVVAAPKFSEHLEEQGGRAVFTASAAFADGSREVFEHSADLNERAAMGENGVDATFAEMKQVLLRRGEYRARKAAGLQAGDFPPLKLGTATPAIDDRPMVMNPTLNVPMRQPEGPLDEQRHAAMAALCGMTSARAAMPPGRTPRPVRVTKAPTWGTSFIQRGSVSVLRVDVYWGGADFEFAERILCREEERHALTAADEERAISQLKDELTNHRELRLAGAANNEVKV